MASGHLLLYSGKVWPHQHARMQEHHLCTSMWLATSQISDKDWQDAWVGERTRGCCQRR